jgi:hypothetical protein
MKFLEKLRRQILMAPAEDDVEYIRAKIKEIVTPIIG